MMGIGCAPPGGAGGDPGGAGELGGKADRGTREDRAEVKVTIADEDVDALLAMVDLEGGGAERRAIHFYDTPDLALFESGLILRARSIAGDDDDSTVKVRPAGADDVDRDWLSEDGFKCELDVTPARATSSCSLTREQDEGEIEDVEAGDRGVQKLFDDEQEQFFEEHGGDAATMDELADLGPIDAQVLDVVPEDLGVEITVELWALPDGSRLLEVSRKTTTDRASDALDELLAWLDGSGISVSDAQETKTRRALEVLAARASF